MQVAGLTARGAPAHGSLNLNGFAVSGGRPTGSFGPIGLANGIPQSTLYASNNTPDKAANITIPHHYINVVPHTDQHMIECSQRLGQGMVLFSRDYESTIRGPHHVPITMLDNNSATFIQVTDLNRWLYRTRQPYKTATELLNEWRFAGVLLTEVGANSTMPMHQRPYSRVLNLAVAGRAKVINLWGAMITETTPLYFIVKKKNVKDRDDIQRNVWQIIPWADKVKRHPTLADLQYTDDHGDVQYGESIYVGFASQAASSNAVNVSYSTPNVMDVFKEGGFSDLEVYLRV